MNKTVKNIVMVFTLVTAIFLIVFCVELILVNRENERDSADASAAASGGDSEENGENGEPDDQEPYDNGADTNGTENGDEGEQNGEETPDASRFELPMLLEEEAMTLIIYADEAIFDFEVGDRDDWFFTYTGDGQASLRISFDFISPAGGIIPPPGGIAGAFSGSLIS